MKTALQGHEPEDFGPAPDVPPTAVAQKVDTPDTTPADGESH